MDVITDMLLGILVGIGGAVLVHYAINKAINRGMDEIRKITKW